MIVAPAKASSSMGPSLTVRTLVNSDAGGVERGIQHEGWVPVSCLRLCLLPQESL